MSSPQSPDGECVSMDNLREHITSTKLDETISRRIPFEKLWSTTNKEYGRFSQVEPHPPASVNNWMKNSELFGETTQSHESTRDSSKENSPRPMSTSSATSNKSMTDQRAPIMTTLPGSRVRGQRLLATDRLPDGEHKGVSDVLEVTNFSNLAGPAGDFMEGPCQRFWENMTSLRKYKQERKNSKAPPKPTTNSQVIVTKKSKDSKYIIPNSSYVKVSGNNWSTSNSDYGAIRCYKKPERTPANIWTIPRTTNSRTKPSLTKSPGWKKQMDAMLVVDNTSAVSRADTYWQYHRNNRKYPSPAGVTSNSNKNVSSGPAADFMATSCGRMWQNMNSVKS